ncbi:MAG: hypothetical protein ACRCTE_07845 [Cellulosilyticaceae bacterium]
MKLLILNGSPKADHKTGNSHIFISHFTSRMTGDYEVRCIAKEKPEVLGQYIKKFDTVLIVMPLYIHAMPSGVMKLIEHMETATSNHQAIGFIIQAGFPESAHEKYIVDYCESLAKRLNYQYLGTVVRGGAAFVYREPERFKKLYKMLAELGHIFEQTRGFDEGITETLAKPYKFSRLELAMLRILKKLGLMNRDWDNMLRQNNALEHALDRPFLEP